ncbi:facilitated trehalose transporter Tret1-like [Leptopilina heterotoma]|uniref:facilitated trehalose transporter Tret1-like n=1 Tax=Leptopilina heterotoma TaxID=63436 RepID=UPI001CA94B0A|nr:facilitated trehalose transporter Tret1-like [Leptopilina heterotoma]
MSEKKVMPPIPGKSRQYLAATTVSLSALAYGTSLGWVAPVLPRLLSQDTPVGSEPMTDETASWLISALCLGGLVMTPILGPLAEKFGRKFVGCLIALPLVLSWLLKIFAQDSSYLIAARFVAGCGGAGCIFIISLYISETTSDAIRGTAGSFLVLFLNIGILLSYIIGPILSFKFFGIVCLCLPVFYLGCFVFLPETPVYLIRNNRLNDAIKSLSWLKGGNKAAIEQELAYLQGQVKETSFSKSSKLSDLFKEKGTVKGLIIAFILLGGQQMCGMFVMLSYATKIFEMSGSSISPDISTIIIGIMQLIGSYISTFLIERAGRKLLTIISCGLMCTCHVVLGIFCHFQARDYDLTSIGWIPVIALSTFVLAHCLGLGPVPFIVVSEIFKPDVASLASSISLSSLWILLFLIVKFFASLMALIGIANCFFLLAVFCACTLFLTVVMVPETKGRTIESIFNELNGTTQSNVKA